MKKTELISLNELADIPENKFVVVAIEETQYWHDDIQKAAKKIEGVYLVNLQEPTHLCELAVSFPAKFLKNFFHNSEFDENAGDILGWSAFAGEDCYLKGSNRYYPRKIYTDEMTEEEIIDYENGNPTVC
jgi:hypothetical protein